MGVGSVNRIHMGSVKLAGRYNPPTFADTRIDVYGYLVITDASDVVLIDTGVGEGNAYVEATFAPNRMSIDDELARFGVAVADVGFVVNSHLHFDHCGNNARFAGARTFIQKAELEVARDRSTRHTVNDWFDYPGARITAVEGDSEVVPGVRLLATPGHTPGHQSVLVTDSSGRTLVAAQAAFTADEFRRGGDPREQAHAGLTDRYRESIVRLKALGVSSLRFSHDLTG
jgi:glyoxylase-like metal-dependent hydrolase (beta-lactamase superfamily II)